MLPRLLRAALPALLVAALLPAAARAQLGASTDIITGRVTTADGRPVPNVKVEATSLETQVTRSRTTNDQGRYTILFPDGGGQYRVVARAIGFAPATATVSRAADEDRLVVDLRLGTAQGAQQLAGVTVRARQAPPQGQDRPAPGTSERVVSGDQLNRLPIDGSDPNAVASLSSGVVATGADTSGGNNAANFSVAGQRPDLNQITLDGLSFGGGGVPQEAVRNTRVVTNTFDVSRGQFTGGQVATTTRAGTNIVQGSFSYDRRDPNLQAIDEGSGAFGQRFSQHQLSGGLGGPIVRDRLFVFGSAQYRYRAQGLQSLLDADRAVLARLGASPDSVRRFLDVLGASGVPAAAAGAPDENLATNLTSLWRLDYTVTQGHTLTLRGDWRWGDQEGARISPLGVPQSGGTLGSLGGGAMLTLTSQWESGMINELRVYGSRDNRQTDPYLTLPGGRVRVRSQLPDESFSTTTLEFGGNAGLPVQNEDAQLELTDEVSYLTPGGNHRLKLGGLLNASAFDQQFAFNRYGIFTFDSLAAFEAGTPSLFTRTFAPTDREGSSINGALYLGDTWRASRTLQLVMGGRLEGTRYTGAPARNAAVEQAFGLRTDLFPDEVHFSPRVGFTWTIGAPDPQTGRVNRDTARTRQDRPSRDERQGIRQAARQGGQNAGPFAMAPALILRGGVGEFRGRAPSGLFTSAVGATGLASGESQLVCIGDQVPVPDWEAYASDASTIPTTCADGTSGGNPFGTRAPNVTAFASDFGAPRSWKASLGAQRRLIGRYFLNLETQLSWGVGLYGATDRNLRETPVFTLDAEGGRPVYVPVQAIVDSTGVLNSLASRVNRDFAGVYEIESGLRSRTAQATLGVNGFTGRGWLVSASYTYSRSADQSSFSCCTAQQAFGNPTTVGNPNQREWSRSDLERRHVVVTTATMPLHPSLELTSIVRFVSGQPYTPRIAGDVNGDGSRNDRAFVFDPSAAAGDTLLANGMSRLLRSAPGSVRECLREQLGQLAARNSCTAGWFPTVDLRVNYRPDRLGLRRNLMLSFLFVNPLAGVDELLHGSKGAKGWGQPVRVDPNLLYVRGFDPAERRFRYEVNERFGDQRGSRNAFRIPFQLAFQARYTVGPDRFRQMMLAGQQAARGGAQGGGGGPLGAFFGPEAVARLQRSANPYRLVVEQNDSVGLGLTGVQRARLDSLADSLDVVNKGIAERVQAEVSKLGNNVDPGVLFPRIQPILQEVRAGYADGVVRIQTILTPEQWSRVPERIRTGRLGGPGGGGGFGGGRPNF